MVVKRGLSSLEQNRLHSACAPDEQTRLNHDRASIARLDLGSAAVAAGRRHLLDVALARIGGAGLRRWPWRRLAPDSNRSSVQGSFCCGPMQTQVVRGAPFTSLRLPARAHEAKAELSAE